MNRSEIARRAAAAGAEVAASYFRGSSLSRWNKADGSLVTRADLEAEKAILSTLRELAPDEPVLAEESGGDTALRNTWVVDPVDGTENFSRGHPVWATLVAWHGSNGVDAAAIDAPALGRRWWAGRGLGAFNDEGRLSTSSIRERAAAGFAFGGIHEYPPRVWPALTGLAAGFRTAWGWGNFWGHVLVAEGVVDAALSYGTSPWDVAAPSLLVTEAGGAWSDVVGERDLMAGSLLTTNTLLHEGMVTDLVRRGFTAPRRPTSDGSVSAENSIHSL